MSNPFQGDETNLDDILGNMPRSQAQVVRAALKEKDKRIAELEEAVQAGINMISGHRGRLEDHIA